MDVEKPVIEQIADLIFWYRDIKKGFNDVAKLQTVIRRLSTLLFIYAAELSDYYKEKNESEYMRKSAFEKEKNRLIKAGESAAAAASAATVFVDDLLNNEQACDSAYKKANLFYDAAQNVFEAMRQQVSTLKTEKSLEFKGGLQQP